MQKQDEEKLRSVSEWFGREAATFQHSRVFEECGRHLVGLATLKPGERALDIGTGTGAVLFPTAEAVGTAGHVTGIDLAEPMVAATRAEALRRNVGNIELRQMNAEHLAFPDGSFDAVVSGFVLMFIPDLPRALREIRRVLRPEGRFAVSVWAGGTALSETTRRIRELRSEYPDPPSIPLSQTFESKEPLVSFLEDAGFQVLRSSAEQVITTYLDEEDYWSQRASQGNDNLPPDLLVRFKEEVFGVLREARSRDGQFQETRTPIYTVATPRGAS